MKDDRLELRFLVQEIRAEMERQKRNGQESVIDEAMPPSARGAATAEAVEAPAPKKATAAAAPPKAAAAAAPGAAAAAAPPKAAGAPSKKRPTPPGPRATVRQPPEPAFAAPGAAADRGVSKRLPAVPPPANDPRDLERLATDLAEFGRQAAECRKCGLCETRTRVVYGSGTARYPLLFVGEAPGFNEDQQGLPFVGQAGKLLTDIIAAMGFDRKDVYIANLLKCRPPENRDPLPHEIEACLPWLDRQIEWIQPRVICTLGKYSAQILTGKSRANIGMLRGKVFHHNGIPVVPTYHPAFLLRSPSYKRATWEDVQLVRELYLAAEAPGDAQGA